MSVFSSLNKDFGQGVGSSRGDKRLARMESNVKNRLERRSCSPNSKVECYSRDLQVQLNDGVKNTNKMREEKFKTTKTYFRRVSKAHLDRRPNT